MSMDLTPDDLRHNLDAWMLRVEHHKQLSKTARPRGLRPYHAAQARLAGDNAARFRDELKTNEIAKRGKR
jgi:hypothetical protein